MTIPLHNVDQASLKVKKSRKAKTPKLPKDIRSVFRAKLKEMDVEKLKKPWMAAKAFKLITDPVVLRAWAEGVIADKSRWKQFGNETRPVLAIDTETVGLDTRIIMNPTLALDGTWVLEYIVKMEIAGVCLSSDGIEGIYVPINHEDKNNMDRMECAAILQWLFDQAHLVFYNAKFDREVMRETLGINFRPYPYFEDIQVLQYINDPKADLGDDSGKGKKWTGDSGGLKALSEKVLGIEQIKGEELMKVKADFFDSVKQKVTQRVQYAPFTWVPTEIALWYAGGDAICTWLLWEKMHELAWSRRLIHRIDHELVETLTWLERQRFLVDVTHHARTTKWHTEMLKEMATELRQLAIHYGFKERVNEDTGEVLEDDKFNPNSNPQLAKLLFEIKKFKVIRMGKELPSVDAEVLAELRKQHPDDDFLKKLVKYKEYVALHPANLRFDPDDHSARIYLKQNVVAGGRLSGAGGEFEVDGGFGLNPQGVVRVEGNWWVRGNVLEPDIVPVDEIQEYTEADLHSSCFHEKDGKTSKAPGIIKNHIGQYSGYAVCLVPKCTTCAEKYGVLIRNGRLDANQVVNIRSMFVAPKGWTFFVIDYSNIEMRAAANISGEPEFIKEFLEGKGDFHALTASKVFPEFNDPNTPKDVKKKLRSLAKIINFALLYGGTQYAIFENMKLEKPDITFRECERMVQDYWKGVPVYADWCTNKKKIAREKMTCSTTTGRIIDFASAMEAQGIHKPTKQEMENYWYHRRLTKKADELSKAKDPDMETVVKLKAKASMLWKDPESGVRNAGDYSYFMGKIERVATNVPIQGICGDFMRIALNRIRQWAEKYQAIESIMRLYLTVHDEIDFAVKNEYAPFVVPRISRLMKLRKYHKSMKWRVGIECDCEYGTSWDVEHHLTGDDGHKPPGWTAIPGMENYIPTEFKSEEVRFWLHALLSGDDARIAGAKAELKVRLHERAYSAFELGDPKNPKKALIAALQLHEYWMIDNIPDEDEDKMETLEQYEARMGLTPADRDLMPEMGFLGAVPQNKVKRPTLQILGEEVPAEDVTITVSGTEMRVEAPTEEKETKVNQVEEDDVFGDVPTRRRQQFPTDVTSPGPTQLPSEPSGAITLDTLAEGYAATMPKPGRVVEIVTVPDGVPELIEMDEVALRQFQKVLGVGRNKLTVRYQGKQFTIPDVRLETVPSEYVKP